MNKDILKIVSRFLLLMIPFFLVLPVYCAHFQPYYMDDEYAMYQAQRDYIDGKLDSSYNSVLIIGDSRAKAALLPERLSKECYNLALGGTSPIEGYYTLVNYLQNHEKPKTVLLSYAPVHYMKVDVFWKRSIYFHYLKKAEILDVFETAKTMTNTEDILTENYLTDFYAYYYYMPNKYGGALKNAGFFFRKKANDENYEQVVRDKGHHYFGLLPESGGVDCEAKVADFDRNDIITYYLEKTIELCNEQDIDVIIEATPVNETSYSIFTESFKAHFREYMRDLEARHPEAQIYTDFYVYPNTMFGDADHLNPAGNEQFASFMKEKYKEVFTK